MVKCYDTQQMSEKFRRHLECDIVQFQFLSEDFSKFAFLLADRTLEFHARYGFHYRTRIPVYRIKAKNLIHISCSPFYQRNK